MGVWVLSSYGSMYGSVGFVFVWEYGYSNNMGVWDCTMIIYAIASAGKGQMGSAVRREMPSGPQKDSSESNENKQCMHA